MFPGEPDAKRFATTLGWVSSWFNVLPLQEAVTRLRTGSLPSRAASITFDDGYADNCLVALPILMQSKLHATFFIATGFLNGGRMWNDTVIEAVRRTAKPELDLTHVKLGRYPTSSLSQRRSTIEAIISAAKYLPQARRDDVVACIQDSAGAHLPGDLMMSDDQVRRLNDAGMEIGAHTRTHPILAKCSNAIAEREIGDGRDDLAALLGAPVRLFAYPNGKPGRDYGPKDVSTVKRMGFDAAVSTARGAARQGADVFQLPRFTPWAVPRLPKLHFAARMAQNLAVDRLDCV